VIFCLVTSRRRLCGPDASIEHARVSLVAQVRRAVDASVDYVIVRERDLDARPLTQLVEELVTATRGSGTRLLVSDRTDVALAARADGVHLRGDSVTAGVVRHIVPEGFLVGRSVHTVAEAVDAGPVDYLVAGTVFPTSSKPGRVAILGLDGLAEIVQATAVPVLAIGGVTRERLDEIAMTGAAGVAAIGLFLEEFDRADGPPYH
jgi:thiamine-phosphate pyrophosphorylase